MKKFLPYLLIIILLILSILQIGCSTEGTARTVWYWPWENSDAVHLSREAEHGHQYGGLKK